MEQGYQTETAQAEDAPRTSPVTWVLRGFIGLCGVMMALVILSEPRVTAQLKAGAGWFAGLSGASGQVARRDSPPAPDLPAIATQQTAPETAQETAPGPARVVAMPTSRVPVRRGEVVHDN